MEIALFIVIAGGAVFVLALVIWARLHTGLAWLAAIVGSLWACAAGVYRLTDSAPENDAVGAALLLGGIALTLGCAVVGKLLFPAPPDSLGRTTKTAGERMPVKSTGIPV